MSGRGGIGAVLWRVYVALFYALLFAPLVVVAVFAFNASLFPAPPWRGTTLVWFLGAPGEAFGRAGLFRDGPLLTSIWTSVKVAIPVTLLSIAVGTTNAFLLERREFWGKRIVSLMMLWPLVIPGVILGISILSLASVAANALEAQADLELTALRPGLTLVVLGQFSFIVTIATLIVAARLRKFDRSLEEAALNLGAGPARVFATVTLPFLRPAMIGAGFVAFLMSFENFNTTLVLVGSEPPLPIYMYGQMREGATPVINAVSLMLMLGTGLIAVTVAAIAARAPR